MCILCAAPFAAMRFITYHGMPAEKFVWVWLRSELIEPRQLAASKQNNVLLEVMKPRLNELEKEENTKNGQDN